MKSRFFLICAVWVATTGASAPASNDLAPVRVRGAHLEADGRPLVLRGVNVNAYSDDENDSVEQTLAITSEEDYRRIAAEGFNCVRLNLWAKAFGSDGGWEWLDRQRAWAARHGLYLILDLHAPPGGYQGPDYKGAFWTDRALQDQTIGLWKEIARRVIDDPAIAALDLLNEPNPPRNADWIAFVRRALPAIREAGWQGPVIVETCFAKDAALEKLDDPSIVYDVHFYDPWDFTAGSKFHYGRAPAPHGRKGAFDQAWLAAELEEQLVRFGRTHGVPLNVGEYGIKPSAEERGGLDYLRDLSELMDRDAIGRQIWCWHTYPGWAIDHSHWHRGSPFPRREKLLRALASPPADEAEGTLGYVLQADKLAPDAETAAAILAASGRNVLVVDEFFSGETPWSAGHLETMRSGKPGRRILAYLSIGEAENYRPYWQPTWQARPPSWLLAENPDWPGNFRVEYWHPDWQDLILAAVDRIVAAGFDGVYLDIVDAFETFEYDAAAGAWRDHALNPATGRTYRRDMIDWVLHIASKARALRPGFQVVPQNGTQLLENERFAATIDALGVEDLFAAGPADAAFRLACLDKLGDKPVFVIEYDQRGVFVDMARAECRRRGFSLLVTTRALDGLGVAFSAETGRRRWPHTPVPSGNMLKPCPPGSPPSQGAKGLTTTARP